MNYKALGLVLILVALGCATMERIAPPVEQFAAGEDTAQLQLGRRIYLQDCTKCHIAYSIDLYDADEWPGILADMSEDAKLDAEEAAAVEAYVMSAHRYLSTLVE